jgi:hypothetical protein
MTVPLRVKTVCRSAPSPYSFLETPLACVAVGMVPMSFWLGGRDDETVGVEVYVAMCVFSLWGWD